MYLTAALLNLLSCMPCHTGKNCPVPPPAVPCPPATAASPDFATWSASIPDPASTTLGLPQYDEGELNIHGEVGGTADVKLGDVWSWASTPLKEGLEMEKLRDYSTSTAQTITEVGQSAPGTEPDFWALVEENPPGTKVKCTDQMDACMALDDYAYGTPPAATSFPETNPAGTLSTVVSVQNRMYNGCSATTPTVTTQGAWLYRTRSVINGQVKWVELWFISSSRMAPSICKTGDPPTTARYDETHGAASTDPPGPRAFVNQLNGVGCTPAPGHWCGYCTTNTCTYTKVEFDWWKKK